MSRDDDRRQELAAFLRARRAALKPADVGLPGTSRRRTPGLRREEVARLSGVGSTWYSWLEQGRPITATAQVVDALARALRLDEAAHAHLRALADLPARPHQGEPAPALERLQRVVDNVTPSLAYAVDHRLDYLVWNHAYAAVWRGPDALPADRRNLIWAVFAEPALRRLLVDWETRARALLGQFRMVAGRYPGDLRLAELVDALSEVSPEFRRWWSGYPVAEFAVTDHRLCHDSVGRFDLEITQLQLVDQPGVTLVLQTPRHDTDRAALLRLLDSAGP